MSNAATADLTELIRDIRNARESIERTSETILDETAQSVQVLMEQYAPVLTGKLRASIRIVSAPGIRTIGPQGVDYAVYQEFGTGIRGEFPTGVYEIRPKDPMGKLHFKIDGEHITASVVHHPGVPPNPFARPAARDALDGIQDRYLSAGVALLTEGRSA